MATTTIQTKMTESSTQSTKSAIFERRLAHLQSPLRPLVSITTLQPHPSFPRTILHYHLLTSAQLDDLARHYHQSSPQKTSWAYPVTVAPRWNTPVSKSQSLERQAATLIWNDIMGCDSTSNSNGGGGGGGVSITSTGTASGASDVVQANGAGIEDKRRRFGRFIGLPWCQSPGVTREEAELEAENAFWTWMERDLAQQREASRLESERKVGWRRW